MNSSSTANAPAMPATPNLWEDWLRTLIEGYPTKEWIEENFTLLNIQRLCGQPHTPRQAMDLYDAVFGVRDHYEDIPSVVSACDLVLNAISGEVP